MGGGGDQAAGAVGNGIVETGIVSSTIGTSGVVFAFSDTPVVDPQLRLHTFCHAVPGKWHLMGVMLSAGGSLQWYRDAYCQPEKVVAGALGHDPYEIICAEAARAPVGSEGLIFLPYLTGERAPYADPNARGVLFGMTRRTDRTHVARAVLEGVAYGMADSFQIMEEMNAADHSRCGHRAAARKASLARHAGRHYGLPACHHQRGRRAGAGRGLAGGRGNGRICVR